MASPSSRLVRSTAEVAAADASAYWSDVICAAFVPVWVRPTTDAPFRGRIDHSVLDGLGLTVVRADAQSVHRTPALIARGGGDSVLVNVQIAGHGRVTQDDRCAALTPGAMAFVDSGRPYSLEFTGPFSQLVVEVPRTRLVRRSLTGATAVALGAEGAGRLVADFLRGLEDQQRADPHAAASLVPHAIGLLDSAVGWATETGRDELPAEAVTRERIHRFVHRHAGDPGLDADMAAAACGISRRTLFRALAAHGESFSVLLRGLRVERARWLLRSKPYRSLTMVAQECGFGGESQLHRAFKAVTGTTPAVYRAADDGTNRR